MNTNRDPVNAMNLDMWKALSEALASIEANSKYRGLIIESGLGKDIFTAGNDLMELYAPATTLPRYIDFWTTQNTFLASLYETHLHTITLIKGATPAAGCMISLTTDYRIATATTRIGLNEPAIGISVPPLWLDLLGRVVGIRRAEGMGFLGKMVDASEALGIGLVDEVVEGGKEEGMARAEGVMRRVLKMPDMGRIATKMAAHGGFARQLGDKASLKEQAETAWQFLSSEAVSGMLSSVMQRLSKSKL